MAVKKENRSGRPKKGPAERRAGKGSARDPLKVLEVIDRLEVGPVRLEKDRLVAPYKVVQGDRTGSIDLIYRFEESVFEPDEPASLNLASVMAAQVAMNYGLFCKEIVFNGYYDDADRKFILEMMENTAREILVKKFLEPNPFLVGEASRLKGVRRKRYLRSRVVFPGKGGKASSQAAERVPGTRHWFTREDRHAIMSSGGKDSLLSFGLLRELGCEVHPVFINESGRHWFTALNAYRHLSRTVPETTRVWTNADRLYSWMLRHFPFIRRDFFAIRSDEYPVRLWTVAVFIFGALPILRKRRIGRLVIGDEYDTTRRLSSRGITHYDGLYDQSRYFDNAMTRYYRRKGWGLVQFSILRHLSELLIEKTLVERYPDIQHHQMSCHAAHTRGNRVYPCGRCEKCRRIVGMLMAIGADPSHCGYTREHVENCLAVLTEKGVHQESAGADHMIYLLGKRDLLPESAGDLSQGREKPEILKVRVDLERAVPKEIPEDLRILLYRIYLNHATGAVIRRGRTWEPLDLLTDPVVSDSSPPRGRSSEKASLPEQPAKRPRNPHLLGELTWPLARERFKEVDVALLPVGSIEQHGPHLPLDTDAFDAEFLATRVAELCSDPKPIVLPLIPYGVSYHHEDFSGTVSISPETLSRMVYEVGMSMARHGIKKLVVVNAHGGNVPALRFATQMVNRDAHIFTCVESGETSDTDVNALIETPNDVHAGEMETSTTLAVRPELVDFARSRKFVPRFSSRYLNFSTKRSVEWYTRTEKISSSGVLGDPTKASRAKGEQIWEMMILRLVEFVEDLKGMTLEEIYQKRY